jgi:2-phosphosulfolactate phosphatase
VRRAFTIRALPEAASGLRTTHAVVAVDVFRATTTIVTALAQGRRVFPVLSEAEALQVAATLTDPLLAGEVAGVRPASFAINNSPAALDLRSDTRPLIVLSSAGTRLLSLASGARAVYVACLRNLSATCACVGEREGRVALIGAGARGRPRPEDSLACAWIGRALLQTGFSPEDQETEGEVRRWEGVQLDSLREGPSADFLRATGQEEDIDFVLAHFDDLDLVVQFDGREALPLRVAREAGA